MCVGMLLWFDVCWRYSVVRLGWCGILMQAEQYTHTHSQAPEDECTSIRNMMSSKKIKQVTSVGVYLFNYQDDARSNKHKLKVCNLNNSKGC